MGTMFRNFLWKSDPVERHVPICCNMWVPPIWFGEDSKCAKCNLCKSKDFVLKVIVNVVESENSVSTKSAAIRNLLKIHTQLNPFPIFSESPGSFFIHILQNKQVWVYLNKIPLNLIHNSPSSTSPLFWTIPPPFIHCKRISLSHAKSRWACHRHGYKF